MSDFFPEDDDEPRKILPQNEWPPRESRTRPIHPRAVSDDKVELSEEDMAYNNKWSNRFTAFTMGTLVTSGGIVVLAVAIKIFRWVTGL